MRSVAVIEGFAGGPMHTRDFRNSLVKAGFAVTKDCKRADIIIAHSAGIYGIPLDTKAKLLMLIGPTYWPGRPLIKRVFRHTKTSRNYHVAKFGWRYYMQKELLGLYYVFRRHNYMWLGITNNNRLGRLDKLIRWNNSKREIIIILNQKDPFSSPEIKEKLKGANVRFIELPGVHDDYVTNHEPYIKLLQQWT